jgi:hypothetical protein
LSCWILSLSRSLDHRLAVRKATAILHQ